MSTNDGLAEVGKQAFAFTALRWVAVLPAAVGAYLLANVIVILAVDVFGMESILMLGPEMDIFVLNGILCPFCFVWFGAKTAPRFRPTTAIVLFVFHSIFSGVILFFVVTMGSLGGPPLWKFVVSDILGLIASFCACLAIRGKLDGFFS